MRGMNALARGHAGRWLIASLLAGALTWVPAAGCRPAGPADKRPSVQVGYSDPLSAAPLLVAAAASQHAKASESPDRIDAVRSADDGAVGAALLAGETSMAVMSVVEAGALFAKGAPVVIVSAVSESYGRDGVVAAAGASLDQLSGLKIGASGVDQAFYVWTMLSRAGVDPSQVIIENASSGAVLAGLRKGTYDAVALSGPYLARASRIPGDKRLFTTKDFPGILTEVLVTTAPYAQAHQDEVLAATMAVGAAGAQLKKTPRQAIPQMSEASVTAADISASLKEVRFLDAADSSSMLGIIGQPGPLVDVAAEAVAFARGSEATAGAIEALFDSRFVNPKS
jgi:NitT/TauT family transport system substrate-binding protein